MFGFLFLIFNSVSTYCRAANEVSVAMLLRWKNLLLNVLSKYTTDELAINTMFRLDECLSELNPWTKILGLKMMVIMFPVIF